MAPRYTICLTEEERATLEAIARSGKINTLKFVYIRALLLCDTGPDGSRQPWNVSDVAEALGVSSRTVEHVKQRFLEAGLYAALVRKPRSDQRKRTFGGDFPARVVALACSPAPAGRARWTIRLLADKVVELQMAPKVSTMTIQRVLKKAYCALV